MIGAENGASFLKKSQMEGEQNHSNLLLLSTLMKTIALLRWFRYSNTSIAHLWDEALVTK